MSHSPGYSPDPDASEVSELFHENSKQQRADLRVGERIMAMMANPLLQQLATAHKAYRSAERVPLPQTFPASRLALDDAIVTRRSARDFAAEPASFEEVAKLVYCGNGVSASVPTHDGRTQRFRTAPSGGALYPTEVYLVALHVDGLPPGVYHHNAVERCLERLRPGSHGAALCDITFTGELQRAAAVLAITGIPVKTKIKYGERGYRFMLLEAGHIAENVLLAAAGLGLAAIPIGGFVDDELDRLLEVNGVDEMSLYLVAVGRPKSSADTTQGLR